MKIVGITMVRNEADIVDLTIRHHLRIGCDAVLAVDNGSTDKTAGILGRLARHDDRITWTSDPGAFRQSEITTILARQAFEIGADWVVPFDADEFWWCRRDKSLRAFLDDAGGAPAFLAPVVNFVQHRQRRRSSRRGLLHLRMRAIPVPPAEDARRLVTDREIGFVEMLYPPKAIFRAGSDVVVPTGNHAVVSASGPPVETNDLACLHAPLRSKQVLEAQAEHGRRVSEVSSDPQTAWHARRWLDLSERGDFEEEWRANSYLDEALDVYGQRHAVEPDARLSTAVRTVLRRHPFR